MGSNRSNGSSKERLKWTKELHDLFEKAVNQIGGPDRATPKGILKAMAIPGLTIFHVKSHLQNINHIMVLCKLIVRNTGCQYLLEKRITSVQKSLKMKIEAQGRFLDKIMEEYTNRAPSTKPVKPYSPILSLPSLSEESDQSNGKEFESDSEDVDTNEMISRDEFQAQKRIKIQDNFLPQTHKHPSFNPDTPNLSMFSLDAMNNNLYAEQEMGFPWSIGAFPSPFQPPVTTPRISKNKTMSVAVKINEVADFVAINIDMA
ncbi:UNVERIFIED_CONTAM: Myb family transcription factor PHL7 [Sesamum angustifolium]|uniref:Myb family transcription factor PHL7 n=1 Tax=Sesamum angustifolium TaxID=2727405 RepID=A0AAW2MP20_9LAMI